MDIRYILLFAFLYSPTTNKLVEAERFTASQLSQIKACAASTFCIGIAPLNYIIQLVEFCGEIPAECPVTPAQLAEVRKLRGSELPTEASTTKPTIDKQKNNTISPTNQTDITVPTTQPNIVQQITNTPANASTPLSPNDVSTATPSSEVEEIMKCLNSQTCLDSLPQDREHVRYTEMASLLANCTGYPDMCPISQELVLQLEQILLIKVTEPVTTAVPKQTSDQTKTPPVAVVTTSVGTAKPTEAQTPKAAIKQQTTSSSPTTAVKSEDLTPEELVQIQQCAKSDMCIKAVPIEMLQTLAGYCKDKPNKCPVNDIILKKVHARLPKENSTAGPSLTMEERVMRIFQDEGTCAVVDLLGTFGNFSTQLKIYNQYSKNYTNTPLDLLQHMCSFIRSVYTWIIPAGIITTILGVIGFFLNLTIFIMFLKQSSDFQTDITSILIVHQAFVDGINCAFNCQISGAGWFAFKDFDHEPLGTLKIYCVTVGFNALSVMSSLFNFMLMAACLYISLHKTRFYIGRSLLIYGFGLLVWLPAISISSVLATIFWYVFEHNMAMHHLENVFLAMTVAFLLVFTVVTVLYIITVCKKRVPTSPVQSTKEAEADITLFVLFFVSFLGGMILYAVSFIYYDVYIFQDIDDPSGEYSEIFYKINGVSTAFFCLSSIANPLLTMFRVPQFSWRQSYRRQFVHEKYVPSCNTSLENAHMENGHTNGCVNNGHANGHANGVVTYKQNGYHHQLELDVIASEYQSDA